MDHYFTNNQNLKSEIKKVNYSYGEHNFTFLSDNGVFSKNKIDYGSKTLIETFFKKSNKRGKFLDVGCGYGFIGLTIAKVLNAEVTMVDVNHRALHLAKRNADGLNIKPTIIESDAYKNLTGEKFDVIITNPPVRAGKKLLLDILINAKDYMQDDGELWYVLRKDQGAKSVEKTLLEFYEIENVEKSNGFYIYFCKKRLT